MYIKIKADEEAIDYWLVLVGENNKTVLTSEVYASRDNAFRSAKRLQKELAIDVYDETTKEWKNWT